MSDEFFVIVRSVREKLFCVIEVYAVMYFLPRFSSSITIKRTKDEEMKRLRAYLIYNLESINDAFTPDIHSTLLFSHSQAHNQRISQLVINTFT